MGLRGDPIGQKRTFNVLVPGALHRFAGEAPFWSGTLDTDAGSRQLAEQSKR